MFSNMNSIVYTNDTGFNDSMSNCTANHTFNGTVNGIVNGTVNGIVNGTVNGIVNGTVDGIVNGTVDGTAKRVFNGNVGPSSMDKLVDLIFALIHFIMSLIYKVGAMTCNSFYSSVHGYYKNFRDMAATRSFPYSGLVYAVDFVAVVLVVLAMICVCKTMKNLWLRSRFSRGDRRIGLLPVVSIWELSVMAAVSFFIAFSYMCYENSEQLTILIVWILQNTIMVAILSLIVMSLFNSFVGVKTMNTASATMRETKQLKVDVAEVKEEVIQVKDAVQEMDTKMSSVADNVDAIRSIVDKSYVPVQKTAHAKSVPVKTIIGTKKRDIFFYTPTKNGQVVLNKVCGVTCAQKVSDDEAFLMLQNDPQMCEKYNISQTSYLAKI